MKHFSLVSLTAIMLAFAPAAMAMTATQKVEKEITRTEADGTVTVERIEAVKVIPGEKIVYSLDIVNTRDEAATDLKLAMPVPVHVKYIEGTADRPGATVRYSVDGGANYADRDTLNVQTVGGVTRPAGADDITHIQWQIAGPISAGTSDSVEFKARLR